MKFLMILKNISHQIKGVSMFGFGSVSKDSYKEDIERATAVFDTSLGSLKLNYT